MPVDIVEKAVIRMLPKSVHVISAISLAVKIFHRLTGAMISDLIDPVAISWEMLEPAIMTSIMIRRNLAPL